MTTRAVPWRSAVRGKSGCSRCCWCMPGARCRRIGCAMRCGALHAPAPPTNGYRWRSRGCARRSTPWGPARHCGRPRAGTALWSLPVSWTRRYSRRPRRQGIGRWRAANYQTPWSFFDEALAVWRGPALADVSYEDWAQLEIRRLEALRLDTIQARVAAMLQLGRPDAVIGEL